MTQQPERTMGNRQVSWVADSAGVYASSDRVVQVRGDDARSWLNGQITNDVRTLAGDVAVYALTLTVKGRVVSDLWVVDDPPGLALVLPSARFEQALARFEQHIIMEDVELQPTPLRVITVQGPRASEVVEGIGARRYACPRLGSGFDVWVDDDAALDELEQRARKLCGGRLDEAGWAAAHLALGIPRVALDFGDDTYPQEAGLKRALSFGKGCYTGQEVVYMLENRGQLARRLVQLEVPEGIEPGAEITDEAGKRLGVLTSGSAPYALGLVKRSHAEAGQTVLVAGSRVRVRNIVGA
jgi:folate-binding protein YgfZ